MSLQDNSSQPPIDMLNIKSQILSQEFEKIKKELKKDSNIDVQLKFYRQQLQSHSGNIKSSLNDLSVALASQAETSDVLEKMNEVSVESMSVVSVQDRSEVTVTEPQLSAKTIAESILSQADTTRSKRRRISSLVIKDVERSNSQSPLQATSIGHDQDDSVVNNFDQFDDNASNTAENNLFDDTVTSKTGNETEVFETTALLEKKLDKVQHSYKNQSEELQFDTEDYSTKPIKLSLLNTMLEPHLAQNNLSLPNKSWTQLKELSARIVDQFVVDLQDESTNIVLDRQNILKLFKKYKLINGNATNEELFELCTKYLPLEDLNIVETALFD